MALSIPQILRQFKTDVGTAIAAETIMKICRYLGHTCRERVLGPVTTVHVFVLQILHGNTACSALSRLAGVPFTATAYSLARSRLPLALFEDLLQHVCDALYPEVRETGRWHGHRTWYLDGSSFSMRDTPELQARFGQPSVQAKGCGVPVAHLLALFHAGPQKVSGSFFANARAGDILAEGSAEKDPDTFCVRVGIAWQGSRKYGGDAHRSAPLRALAALADVPGVRLISLQMGPGAEQLREATDWDVIDLGGRLKDFVDTAAVMKHLDLVISVDTAVAHLAGALGVPVWLALCTASDWRWLQGRDDSPWYLTARLFRQKAMGRLARRLRAHGR
jgi:Glycosyltransferase family 9 (heptosyltransferase)